MNNRPEKAPEFVWWEEVSGPSLFLRKAVEVLCEGQRLCLVIPETLPWRDFFFERLKTAVRDFNNVLIFEDLKGGAQDPGKALIEHFNLEAEYRPTKSYADFLSRASALSDRVICVTAEDEASARRWLVFAREYKPSSRNSALLIILTPWAPPGANPKGLQTLAYKDFVTEYDTQIFSGLLLPENIISIEWKKYLTAVIVALMGIDAPRVADFIKTLRFDGDNAPLFDDGLSTANADLSRRVWNAQVQILFPLIMRECWETVEKMRDRLDEAFAYADGALHGGLLNSNQERIMSPDEIREIGTIRYLMRSRRFAGGDEEDYILYLPDERLRDRIELLYVMRNQIAHGKACPMDEVKSLLRLFQNN